VIVEKIGILYAGGATAPQTIGVWCAALSAPRPHTNETPRL
jgi:hypothetical protein